MSRNPIYIKLIQSKKWKLLRLNKLISNPVCEVCEEHGRSTLATEVHHVVPVESVVTENEMYNLMFMFSNLKSVCHACHSDIHKQMFSHSKEAVKENTRKATKRFVDKFLK